MSDELTYPSHPSEDLLEQYALGRLVDDELAQVEEHLLFCPRCQENIEELDAFIRATRKAAAQLPLSNAAKPKHSWRSLLYAVPTPAAGIALAAMVLIVTAMTWRRFQTPQTVDLSAMRGAPTAMKAKAYTPVRLNLDGTGLSAGATYTLELVDETGVPKWDQRNIPTASTRLNTVIDRSLRPGQYFVRLYSDSLKNELLKEYSLVVE